MLLKSMTKHNHRFFGLIHNSLKNSLILFGGYDYFENKYMDSILEYNISQNKWYKLPVLLPNAMWKCVCTMAIHNRYALIFGGANQDVVGFEDILIYCFKTQSIKISKVKSPCLGDIYESAITVTDQQRDEKIVFGYVRDIWKLVDTYLLKLMHSFYLNEYVYLLEKYNSHKHWKMSTLDIV
eukprot:211742_1